MKKLNLFFGAVMIMISLTASAQSKKEVADARKQLNAILAGNKLTESIFKNSILWILWYTVIRNGKDYTKVMQKTFWFTTPTEAQQLVWMHISLH